MTHPEEITRDTINLLRLQGLREEADRLLKLRKEYLAASRKNDLREEMNKSNRKKRFLLHREGLCVSCHKPLGDGRESSWRCVSCEDRSRRSARVARRLKKKSKE